MPSGFNYLGTIDDVAVRFPWRFKLTDSALNHSLITQLLDGRPILLNDGYLVHHAIARQALLDQTSLLWELMRVGYVRVMARGGDDFTLAEMPEKMARAHKIDSFSDLVTGQISGVDWPELRGALASTDQLLRSQKHLIDWPAFESGTGYRAFAQRILDKQSSPRSLGMAKAVNQAVLHDFLKHFVTLMDKNPAGPRDQWEKLAKRMARNDDRVRDATSFVQSMMVFATETYHYNMGVMLAAHYKVPVSVETQTSPAFDDLLIKPEVVVDELPSYPRLQAPLVLATVAPKLLASIVDDPHSKLAKARTTWITKRDAWEQRRFHTGATNKASQTAELADLKEAGSAYAAALSGLLGKHVKYEQTEGIFNTVVSAVVHTNTTAASLKSAAATAAALAALGLSAPVTASGVLVAGVAAGYIVSQTQKKLLGGVTRKFRINLLKNQLLKPSWVARSQQVVAKINRRRSPSSIEIDVGMAADLIKQLKPFERK